MGSHATRTGMVRRDNGHRHAQTRTWKRTHAGSLEQPRQERASDRGTREGAQQGSHWPHTDRVQRGSHQPPVAGGGGLHHASAWRMAVSMTSSQTSSTRRVNSLRSSALLMTVLMKDVDGPDATIDDEETVRGAIFDGGFPFGSSRRLLSSLRRTSFDGSGDRGGSTGGRRAAQRSARAPRPANMAAASLCSAREMAVPLIAFSGSAASLWITYGRQMRRPSSRGWLSLMFKCSSFFRTARWLICDSEWRCVSASVRVVIAGKRARSFGKSGARRSKRTKWKHTVEICCVHARSSESSASPYMCSVSPSSSTKYWPGCTGRNIGIRGGGARPSGPADAFRTCADCGGGGRAADCGRLTWWAGRGCRVERTSCQRSCAASIACCFSIFCCSDRSISCRRSSSLRHTRLASLRSSSVTRRLSSRRSVAMRSMKWSRYAASRHTALLSRVSSARIGSLQIAMISSACCTSLWLKNSRSRLGKSSVVHAKQILLRRRFSSVRAGRPVMSSIRAMLLLARFSTRSSCRHDRPVTSSMQFPWTSRTSRRGTCSRFSRRRMRLRPSISTRSVGTAARPSMVSIWLS
eukprot:m.95119 g.95119  ORF g.95119 m.95119 type:complete len:579 (+) comp8592_c0_seq1:239-1975(+)